MRILWRWSVRRDEWEQLTVGCAAEEPETERRILRGYKRRDHKGVRLRWTDDTPPKKYRTRSKKEAA